MVGWEPFLEMSKFNASLYPVSLVWTFVVMMLQGCERGIHVASSLANGEICIVVNEVPILFAMKQPRWFILPSF